MWEVAEGKNTGVYIVIYSAHSLNDGEPTETRLERAMITLVTDYIRVQREVNMCVSLARMP